MNETGGPQKAAAPPAAAAPQPGNRTGQMQLRMPRSFEQMLRWLDPKDYKYAEAVLCHHRFLVSMVAVLRVVDGTVGDAQKAEYRAGSNRVRGAEMDEFRDEIDAGLQRILKACLRMSERAGAKERLVRKHRMVFKHHRISLEIPKEEPRAPQPPKAAKPGGATAAA